MSAFDNLPPIDWNATYIKLHTSDPGKPVTPSETCDPGRTTVSWDTITWSDVELDTWPTYTHYVLYGPKKGLRAKLWRWAGRVLHSDRLGRRGTFAIYGGMGPEDR